MMESLDAITTTKDTSVPNIYCAQSTYRITVLSPSNKHHLLIELFKLLLRCDLIKKESNLNILLVIQRFLDAPQRC